MIHIFATCPSLLQELQNLPHAMTGNPEDADTNAPDHLMDAVRYLLLNIGGGPRMVLLDEEKPSLMDGVEILHDAGLHGIRPHDVDHVFSTRIAEREGPVGATQRSPFA